VAGRLKRDPADRALTTTEPIVHLAHNNQTYLYLTENIMTMAPPLSSELRKGVTAINAIKN
jgi:hypothetical protein